MIDILMKYHEDAEMVAICDMFEPALINVRNQAEELGIKISPITTTSRIF